jgi:NCS2 family nucleobase:cation symporter-2
MKKPTRSAPFFGLNDPMPVLLALLLGLQHALAMLAGIITPPILISGYAKLDADTKRYLVSTALIVAGILSSIQITRFKIRGTPYYIGTGLLSVVGMSFSIIPVAASGINNMYASGFCPSAADGTPLPCPKGYGALIGTTTLCALIEILMSFMPPKALKRLFPPLVTGPVVMLIGVSLTKSGLTNWAGGSCNFTDTDGNFLTLCPSDSAPHALPWGSAEFIGLGFLVFVTIILCERFGSPIMKSTSVVWGLLVGCIVAAACNYFDKAPIDAAPAVSFIWVKTFPLSVYGPIVLPCLTVYLVLMMEAIGDVTASAEVSRQSVTGPLFDSRIQGGVLADGLNGLLAGLATMTPMSTFAQNNGVIALTRCANRKAGYACCFFLVVMGIFSKFAAALVAIPASVLGGMTTFLFASVAVSGIKIMSQLAWTRKTRFILTASLALGFGATLLPEWFAHVFTYDGPNAALKGFMQAIEVVMETGFAVSALVSVILNLAMPEEVEEDLHSIAGDEADDRMREEEVRHGKEMEASQSKVSGSSVAAGEEIREEPKVAMNP